MTDEASGAGARQPLGILESAVRRLLLHPGAVRERALSASAIVVDSIGSGDLADASERRLLERIQLALIELDLLGRPAHEHRAPAGLHEGIVQDLARDVLALRDTVMLRTAGQDAQRSEDGA